MCKASTSLTKDQILKNLLCNVNGVNPEMEIKPSCSVSRSYQNKSGHNMLMKSEESACNDDAEEIEQDCSTNVPQSNELDGNGLQDLKTDDLNPLFVFRLQENVINSIRPESKAVVDDLIEQIEKLSLLQKMLLYLKLPLPRNDPDQTDPLRKPLNPLGNRTEISQALAYIKTHFLPDPEVSLPKKEIYNEYVAYCAVRKIKPLSTADFGKAMKQVYPVVRPRRLGERGNSRYCYSGLRNRASINRPKLPGSSVCQAKDCISKKICGWASKVLNVPVDNLTELSTLIPSSPSSNGSEHLQATSPRYIQSEVSKTVNKELKIEVESSATLESESKKKRRTRQHNYKSQKQKTNSTKGLKHSVDTLSAYAQSPFGISEADSKAAKSDKSNVCDTSNQNKIYVGTTKIKQSPINCLDLKTDNSTNFMKRKNSVVDKRATMKKSRKSIITSDNVKLVNYKNRAIPAVESQSLPTEYNFGIASIEEDPSTEIPYITKGVLNEDISRDNLNCSKQPTVSGSRSDVLSDFMDSSEAQDCDRTDDFNDIGCITSDGIGHFLQDEGNSQEPEEELLKYFKEPGKSEIKKYDSNKDISQLRLLLEHNLPEDTTKKFNIKPLERNPRFSEVGCRKAEQMDLKNGIISSPQQNLPQQPALKQSFQCVFETSLSKRRVSFENIPECQNVHGKSFSFAPISPRPPTVSKSSVNSSPFVFPRETVFRGKLSTGNVSNTVQQNPSPSTVQARLHASPLKSLSQSTSLSSTPSPITNGRNSSFNIVFKGRLTPQEVSHEQTDSVKSSPIISPNSSSGVFLSPASPMSSCNSPIFTFRKSMSPVKQTDEPKQPLKCNSSLLHSLLLTGKCPDITPPKVYEKTSTIIDEPNEKQSGPLAIDVYQFSHEDSPFPFRSYSLPTLTNSVAVSPLSNTLPFTNSATKSKEMPPLLEIKQDDIDIWDSVLGGYKSPNNDLLIDNMSDNDTVDSNSQTVGNEQSMESVISNLYDFLSDKGLSGTNENVKLPQVSRSHPNTPLIYNECSNSSRDPVVSAFPVTSTSKSYPSTPTACTVQSFNNVTISYSTSAKRNVMPLLDNLPIPVPSFSDDIELHLNNFTDLSDCDDAFNDLAIEVASSDVNKEL